MRVALRRGTPLALRLLPLLAAGSSSMALLQTPPRRADGVIIQHDPNDPELIAKYGAPGSTDPEGFDPGRDTVGPGIYGGRVVRDESGQVVWGKQYQNHNPRPGPVYAGGGYTPTVRALHESSGNELRALLTRFPDLVNEVETGGATPLHMCGMSRVSQRHTALLIELGGGMETEDTYGYRPLHRMASNNLAEGAAALLAAGADAGARTASGETPLSIARASGASDVLRVLRSQRQ